MPDYEDVTPALLASWPLPEPGDDKESRGRALLVGGSASTPGALILGAQAALRSGAGKLQVATVRSLAPHLAVALPEALVVGLPEASDGGIDPAAVGQLTDLAGDASAVLVGPGMTGAEQTAALVRDMLCHVTGTLALDALGLAAVTEDPTCLHALDGLCVLTPNLVELSLTLGEHSDAVSDDPHAAVRRLATLTRCAVTSGGAESWTTDADGRSWRDTHGGSGLGVSGSGDVLAGAVCGLAARGAAPAQAAVWGSYLHKRAGERLAVSVGPVGFLARELLAEIPRVLVELSELAAGQ